MRTAVLFVALTVWPAASFWHRVPADLWVVPFNSGHAAEMVLAQSLQGITGRHGPKLWLDRPNTMSAVILGELDQEGVRIHRVSSVWDLPDELWASASGFVLYQGGTPSLNASISLAGLWDAVAAESSIADQVAAKGLAMIYDATGLDDGQVFDQYGDQFARGIAIDQALTKPAYLRDFAIQRRAFTFWAGADREFRQQVVAALGPGTTVYGWGPSEHQWIADFSASGGGGVAADFCVNLSAMSKLGVAIPPRADRPPPDPAQEGERIVAFVLSDGDNIQWQTGGMPLDQKWYASPLRGEFNMNWEVSPLLARVAPRVLRYFYNSATESDSFVAAGTPSYRYIHFEPDPRGAIDAEQVAPYLRKGRLSIVSVINDNQGSLDETIPLLDLPEVDGVIYKKFSPYEGLHGQMLWHAGKPTVSYKLVLWENHAGGSIDQVASAIAAMPASPETDPGSYALVNVHAWSWASIGGPIEAVKETIDRLPPATRVVLIDDFFSLLKQNLLGLQKAVRHEGCAVGVDHCAVNFSQSANATNAKTQSANAKTQSASAKTQSGSKSPCQTTWEKQEINITCSYRAKPRSASNRQRESQVALRRAVFELEPLDSSDMHAELTFTNNGARQIADARAIYLEIDDDAGNNYVRRLLPTVDFRQLQPGQSRTFSEVLRVAAFPPGHYKVQLWIPDPDKSQMFNAAHNFLLDNAGVADVATRLNVLADFTIERKGR